MEGEDVSRRKCVKLVTYNFLFGADYAPVKYAALSYGPGEMVDEFHGIKISQCPDSGIYASLQQADDTFFWLLP